MSIWYNDNDPYIFAWLPELITARHLTKGEVDERSITDWLQGLGRANASAGSDKFRPKNHCVLCGKAIPFWRRILGRGVPPLCSRKCLKEWLSRELWMDCRVSGVMFPKCFRAAVLSSMKCLVTDQFHMLSSRGVTSAIPNLWVAKRNGPLTEEKGKQE